MSSLAVVLSVSLAGVLLLWAVIFWAVGRRPRRPRPRLWSRVRRKKPEPVMSIAELEESFRLKK